MESTIAAPAQISPLIETTQCPKCHIEVRITDYYCFNCGQALLSPPKSVSLFSQITLYIASLLLPPMGIIWGIRYLLQDGRKQKIVGTIAIVLTVVSLIVATLFAINLVNTINQQIETQMNTLMAY